MQMNRFLVATALMAAFLGLNFSSQDTSVDGSDKKPPINFYGTLTDSSGQKYQVEDITISGMYKQIPVYQKPKDKQTNPNVHITRLDFVEIHMIKIPNPQDILTYNSRQYIEIEVTSRDTEHTKQNYIIERSKRIICDQINSAGRIEKDLAFEAIDFLVFEGHKGQTESPDKNEDSKIDTSKKETPKEPTVKTAPAA